MNLFIEILNHSSVLSGIGYAFTHPLSFLFGCAVVLIPLSLTQFFKHRLFVYVLVLSLWMTLGITNGVVIAFRSTPLSAIDFYVIRSALSMITVYINIWQLALIAAAFVALVILLVFIFRRCRKYAVNYKNASILLISSVLVISITFPIFLHLKIFDANFDDMNEAYRKYGFLYCFAASIINKGVDEPQDFDASTIDDILNYIGRSETDPETADIPNVIYLQLESFFDVSRIKGVEFPEDPIPNFHRLCEEYPSGALTVSTIGGGTANTEFEVLTGMNLLYFGPGEYPYQTILQDNTCESTAYLLRDYGLSAHAIHNHTGSFYDRYEVYSRLGFDTFTPSEYMTEKVYNSLGWEKDSVLTGEIMRALESTESHDFVFAVSVQAHGRYPSYEPEDYSYTIKPDFSSGGFSPDTAYELGYYVNEIYEVDKFLKNLVDELENYPEPVILVIYGDHLPAISIGDDALDGNLKQTDYVIWSNYTIEASDKDITAYQLSAHTMKLIGVDNGILNRLNQIHDLDEEKYQYYLESLEYDMLYGEKRCYGGDAYYTPTNMKFGTVPIKITGAGYDAYGHPVISGIGFTESSVVAINDKKYSAVLREDGSLYVDKRLTIKKGDVITVRQITSDFITLGISDRYIVDRPVR